MLVKGATGGIAPNLQTQNLLGNCAVPSARILLIEKLDMFSSTFLQLSVIPYHFCMMASSNGNTFPRYWSFVRGIHRSPVNSPHKGQWRGALMFSLICAWINCSANNRDAGDLRRHRAHYYVTVMVTEWRDAKYPTRSRGSSTVKIA